MCTDLLFSHPRITCSMPSGIFCLSRLSTQSWEGSSSSYCSSAFEVTEALPIFLDSLPPSSEKLCRLSGKATRREKFWCRVCADRLKSLTSLDLVNEKSKAEPAALLQHEPCFGTAACNSLQEDMYELCYCHCTGWCPWL